MAKSGHRSSHCIQAMQASGRATRTTNASISRTLVGQNSAQILQPLQYRSITSTVAFALLIPVILLYRIGRGTAFDKLWHFSAKQWVVPGFLLPLQAPILTVPIKKCSRNLACQRRETGAGKTKEIMFDQSDIERRAMLPLPFFLRHSNSVGLYRFMLPISPLTAATELSNIACSSSSSLNSMIFSTPPAPRTQGTPT